MDELDTKTDQEPAGTKERILAAAKQEFAAKGYAGARVDAIAKAAHVNIRMIYYFFKSKKKLLQEVLKDRTELREPHSKVYRESIEEYLLDNYHAFRANPESIRLIVWEALQLGQIGKEEILNFDQRTQMNVRLIKNIEDLQKAGKANKDLDADLLHMILVGMTIYPMILPQVMYLITGGTLDDEAQSQRFERFLMQMAEILSKPSA